jgi:signal transduction histidine kinase
LPSFLKPTASRIFRKTWHYIRFGWPTIALVAFIAFGGYFLMLDTAHDQDRAYVQSTRDFVRTSVTDLANDNVKVSTDYSLWSDAYENITLQDNQKWMTDNYFTTNVSTLSVYRPGQGVRFSYVEEGQEALRGVIPQIVPFLSIERYRAYQDNPIAENLAKPIGKIILVNGALFSLATQPIRPYDNFAGPKPRAGSQIDYVIALNKLDQQSVSNIGKSFALSNPKLHIGTNDASVVSANRINYAIKDESLKTIAVISWDNLRPGTIAMKARLVPVYVALLLIMALTIVITHNGVSARLRLFKAAREAAETANRVKSNFLASVSHELRTPLSGIIGYAEMIEEDARDTGNDITARDARKVTNSAQHLLSVINDLLDHTKIEAGKMDLNPAQTNVVPIFASVVENLQHQVTKKNTTLKLVCDPAVGEAFLDGMRLKQCLFNLVSNAAKFTKDGAIVVSARLVDHDATTFIRIAVKDTGIGMSRETIAKLFTPFTQADEGTAAKFGGSGLGLVITKALIEAMGGRVQVESTLGDGSIFTILVPQGLDKPAADLAKDNATSLAA